MMTKSWEHLSLYLFMLIRRMRQLIGSETTHNPGLIEKVTCSEPVEQTQDLHAIEYR